MQKIVLSIIICLFFLETMRTAYLFQGNIRAYANKEDYFNYFPQLLSEQVKGKKIALTEAGRFGYFLRNNLLYDLVGLNTLHTSKNSSSKEYLQSIDPDIIFFHSHVTVDKDSFNPCGGIDFCSVNYESISKSFTSETNQLLLKDDLSNLSRIKAAPISSFQFLQDNKDKYEIIVVSYLGDYVHFYAVKKNLKQIFLEKIKLKLKMAFELKNPK